YKDFHPDFHWLFNSYYNSLGEMPAKSLRASFSRPPLEDILAYRAHVDGGIARLLEASPEFPANAEAARRIALGLEHEQQHQELIATDIKHAFFTNPLHPAYREVSPGPGGDAIAPPLEWMAFSPGLVKIGVTPDSDASDTFCFDNETPRHTVFLEPFSLASRLVTCAEYLGFIDDSGYTRPELWLAEGWTMIRAEGWQAPLYWQRDPATASGWHIFTLHGWQPLDELSEVPVCHLSFFEADAYARWAARNTPGARLPTEFEWEFAASQMSTLCRSQSAQPELYTWTSVGDAGAGCDASLSTAWTSAASGAGAHIAASATRANLLETGILHPARASALPGLQQIFGDAWEWTSSAYTGYPGYHPLPGALGEYNGKFMSSQMILRGGSCVTPATHIRATYRNFFAPGTRWQFSGLRLAKDGS
ncbi:MAG TPA: ergothioneine biosynthesis protein EgtB, partial [Acidobacteriaceae bacterium]|nr:ergothioneine biosynthesis protein EgtB [Acidobacteriaceae bacterium]